ncbi:MAG TPA: LuxR C-terminal-related transcriptional regulator [Streptosporangiaceae bacterium]|nr:LuxR C-terminal-related transcriptional regulator [Streptosporangiaceae bacterium]
MAYPDAENDHPAGLGATHGDQASGATHGDQASGAAEGIAVQLRRARLQPTADQRPTLGTGWAFTLSDGSERPVSRVAALSQIVQAAMRLGRASECFAALDEQRAAAGADPAALVWALTASAACRAIFGQLGRARADLAEARRACYYATPLLAEPFWLFTELICKWLGGDWTGALADAAAMDAKQISVLPSALAGAAAALRVELQRGGGAPGGVRQLARKAEEAGPPEMAAWALAGLDIDDGRPEAALQRLADVCDVGTRELYRVAMPLVLFRIADIAFSSGDRAVLSFAATALADLDQAAPVNEILAGLARAFATGDAGPARHAQQQAKSEGAGTLAAEALTVRGRIGDAPASTLAEAYGVWERAGATGKARAVAALMRRAGLRVPGPAFPPAGQATATGPMALTARERSVALLVHEGRSNQQIAKTLNISVKTVEAYLTRLYRKTGCSSRVELAVAVTERRLLPDEQQR